MSSSQHRCVFVGNIPYDATEEELIRICEEVGPVVSFRLVLDRDTGKPKGYGFCEYRDEETALSARRNLQGYDINGRQLRVDFAENEKGSADRREQAKGRGGPGLIDASKQAGGLKGRDASLHQPVGLPAAVSAAAVMASLLGGPQLPAGTMVATGVIRPPVGIDALTIHLAGMSKYQLYEILNHMKNFIQQNQQQARQVLASNAQLVKALFQMQIILGWVPQVPLQPLQTQTLQQPSVMPLQQGQVGQQAPSNPQLLQGLQQPQMHRPQSFLPPLSAHLQQQAAGRSGPMLIPPQPLAPPPSNNLGLPPLNLAMQQRPQLPPHLNPPPLPNQVRPSLPPSPPQGAQATGFQHTFSQSANLPQQSSGALPNMPFIGALPPIPNQPPPHLLQVPGNGSIGQGGLPSSAGLMIPTTGGITQFGRAVGVEIPVTSAPYANWNPLPASSGSMVAAPLVTTSMLVASMPMGSNMVSSNNQQGGLRGPPFEGPGMLHSQDYSQGAMQLPIQPLLSQQLPSQQLPNQQPPNQQLPNQQLPSQQLPSQQQSQVSLEPEQQKALLQQVMNLTPEQINSLPPEQRQQVLDLQQAFRNQII